jgi:hypothetical protein
LREKTARGERTKKSEADFSDKKGSNGISRTVREKVNIKN